MLFLVSVFLVSNTTTGGLPHWASPPRLDNAPEIERADEHPGSLIAVTPIWGLLVTPLRSPEGAAGRAFLIRNPYESYAKTRGRGRQRG